MGGHWRARRVVAVLAAVCACWIQAAAQSSADVQSIVARVGERVAEYYRRAQSLVCTEISTVQPIEENWSADGMPRTVESELHVEFAGTDGGAGPDASVVRRILKINGRIPRARDQKDSTGCTDPELLSTAPLDFLLPAHRSEYRFTSAREVRSGGRAAIAIDFKSADSKSHPELNEDPRGHASCLQMSGSIAIAGRVWVDVERYDVLRVEQHLEGPVDIRVPWTLQRRDGLPDWITLDRYDLTLEYKLVAFTDPREALLLPSSVDEMSLWRGHILQSVRRSDAYSDYRRFLTDGHIVRDER